MTRVAFGCIVFNGAHFLWPMLECIYPFAHEIIVIEGPVTFWQKQGYQESTDGTLDILRTFPDPDRKIVVRRGQWVEKDDMCNAYMALVDQRNTEYIWHIDADECYHQEDVVRVLDALGQEGYDSVGFMAYGFFGNFNTYLAGFEEAFEMHRIKRYYAGARWATHRPPTILSPQSGRPFREHNHLGYEQLANIGIRMYHYTKVFPRQVWEKTYYYLNARPSWTRKTICDYFKRVYVPWTLGTPGERAQIEDRYDGVHHFLPSARGPCRTRPFAGAHPASIAKRLPQLERQLQQEIALWCRASQTL